MRNTYMHVQGLDELDRKLSKLSAVAAREILLEGLDEGADVIVWAARYNAPFDESRTGGTHLKDAIKKGNHRVGNGKAEMSVGVDYKESDVGHLVEFGTGPRFRFSAGRSGARYGYSGAMPGRPFMRPAFDSKKNQAMDIITRTWWQLLKKAARR